MARYDPWKDKFFVEGDTHMIRCPNNGAKQTNGDRIRAMTDEEMAVRFAMYEARSYRRLGHGANEKRFEKEWLDWLKQEVESDG